MRAWLWVAAALVAMAAPVTVAATPDVTPIPFDKSWKKQGFFRFWSNRYDRLGDRLKVTSEATVSLIYTRLPDTLWSSRKASWRWVVDTSVAPTDLTRKGGDDRNLVLYFVFIDPQMASRVTRYSAGRLLRNENVRALTYIWGGDMPEGTVFVNPYGPERLGSIALHPAAVDDFTENVDLAADYRRVYGAEAGALVAIGITADSDDTDGRIDAFIEGLTLH